MEMINSILSQILTQEARARRMCVCISQHNYMCLVIIVNSIALVKPDKAKAIEQLLIRMARSGQLQGKVPL